MAAPLPCSVRLVAEGHPAVPVRGVVLSASGEKAVQLGSDGTVRLLSVGEGHVLASGLVPHPGVAALELDETASRVAVRPLGGKDLSVWDTRTAEATPLPGHGESVNGAAFLPSSSRLVTISRRRAMLHDLATGVAQPLDLDGMRADAVRASPDGAHFLVIDWLAGRVHVWKADGRRLADFRAEESGLEAAEYAPSGEAMGTLSTSGEMALWTLAGEKTTSTRLPEKPRRGAIAFSPEGLQVYAVWFGHLAAWETGRGSLTIVSGIDVATGPLAVSRDGAKLALPKLGSNFNRGLYVVESRELRSVGHVEGLADHVSHVAFGTDSRSVSFAARTGAVYSMAIEGP